MREELGVPDWLPSLLQKQLEQHMLTPPQPQRPAITQHHLAGALDIQTASKMVTRGQTSPRPDVAVPLATDRDDLALLQLLERFAELTDMNLDGRNGRNAGEPAQL